LVFIGHLFEKIEQRRGVRFVGHVSIDELPVFYSGAEALVYPSLYEGFGLPILEAFACRTPVVTSNISSLPEVAGGAAELVDPYDTDSIAEGIRAALGRRKGLIKKGLKRVEDFSWEKTAKMTLEVYNEAKR
ncbi:MAG: glycosyltransferase family 1 protein, partial [Microgenomates group bacterium]